MSDEHDPIDGQPTDAPEATETDDGPEATESTAGPETTEPGSPTAGSPAADGQPDPSWAPPSAPIDPTPTASDDRRWPRRLALGAAVAGFGALSMLAGGAIALAVEGGDWWDDHDGGRHGHATSTGERDGRR